MSKEPEPKLKKNLKTEPAAVFLIAAAILIFGPFASMNHVSGWVLDCAIQIKLGLDAITSGHLITDEIYSWHDGLVFTAHETGWYLVLGFVYKFFRLWGVLALSALFTCGTAVTAVKYMRKTAHPLICLVVMALACLFKGFPDYNARPSTASAFILTVTVVVLISEKDNIFKACVFVAGSFLLAWLHGGMLPLYFAVLMVFIVIELIYKQFRTALSLAAGAAAGFILSLANPIGFRLWTYSLVITGSRTVVEQTDEWNPVAFTLLQMFLILMVFIGSMAGKGIREFEKKAITKLCLLCMFLILACVFRRFMMQFTLMFLLFAPKAYQDVLVWLTGNLVPKLKDRKLELSDAFYYILIAVCTVMFIGAGIFNVKTYMPTGTMTDIEKMAAYDGNVVTYVQQRGYKKLFNDFNSGSWLVFRGVKVHCDNRADPYVNEASGTDHLTGKMTANTLFDLDNFRAEYDNDAFLLTTNVGYSPLIYEIETYASDRYKVVYDKTVTSNMKNGETLRWIVIECLPEL